MQAIKVLILEENSKVKENIKNQLSANNALLVAGEFQYGPENLAQILALMPDVVLLDIDVPKKNSVELINELRQNAAAINILALTVNTALEPLYKIIKAGVLGFILKDADQATFYEAIQTVARGDAYIQPCLLSKFLNEIRQSTDEEQQAPPQQLGLTGRELEIVNYIARGRSNKDIAEKLFISEKTVKNHVSNILRKMELEDRTQVAIYAYQKGLITR